MRRTSFSAPAAEAVRRSRVATADRTSAVGAVRRNRAVTADRTSAVGAVRRNRAAAADRTSAVGAVHRNRAVAAVQALHRSMYKKTHQRGLIDYNSDNSFFSFLSLFFMTFYHLIVTESIQRCIFIQNEKCGAFPHEKHRRNSF